VASPWVVTRRSLTVLDVLHVNACYDMA